MSIPYARTVQIAVVVGIVASTTVGAAEPVEVRVSSAFVLEGSNVQVTVRIVPDQDNRFLTIQADSPDYYRSSRIQLSGDEAPLIHTMMLRSLPSGLYEVRAILSRTAIWSSRRKCRSRLSKLADAPRSRCRFALARTPVVTSYCGSHVA
jgi:hypothetical protein